MNETEAQAPTWEWCGQAHHFVGSDSCRFHMATWVGGGRFLVSTVGDYRPRDAEGMETLGLGDDSFFETYVFRTDPANRHDVTGHPQVEDWSEVAGERCATHEEANRIHMSMCHQFNTEATADV